MSGLLGLSRLIDGMNTRIGRWLSWLINNRAEYRPGGPERPARFATGLPLMVLACVLARTPDVPLPPLPD